jgi:shikimate kinase
MPGVGKSTLGKKLAAQVKWKFIDLDIEIEKRVGISIAEMFEKKGESYFREQERETLRSFINHQQCIIACGGGTPAYFDNLDWMKKNGIVCYLEATLAFILSRIGSKNEQRPMFFGLNEDEKVKKMIELLRNRSSYYEQAHYTIRLPIKSLEPLLNIVFTGFPNH